MYNPADVRWDVLNDIMSLYYLCYYQIFGLNGLGSYGLRLTVLVSAQKTSHNQALLNTEPTTELEKLLQCALHEREQCLIWGC